MIVQLSIGVVLYCLSILVLEYATGKNQQHKAEKYQSRPFVFKWIFRVMNKAARKPASVNHEINCASQNHSPVSDENDTYKRIMGQIRQNNKYIRISKIVTLWLGLICCILLMIFLKMTRSTEPIAVPKEDITISLIILKFSLMICVCVWLSVMMWTIERLKVIKKPPRREAGEVKLNIQVGKNLHHKNNQPMSNPKQKKDEQRNF